MMVTYDKKYWIGINKNFKNYPKLTTDTSCDVVVVGGGLAGCMTAYYLSQYNIKTILIDKDLIAQSNTGSCTASFQYGIDKTLGELIALIGESKALRAFKLCQKAIDDIENLLWSLSKPCDFERKQNLYTNSKIDMESEYKLRKNYNFNVDYIEEKDTLTLHSCAVIDPFKLSHALAKAISGGGGMIYEHTPLLSYDYSEDKMRVNTGSYKIYCKKIVFASGVQTLGLLKDIDFKVIKTINLATNITSPINKINNHTNSSTDDKLNLYVRPTYNNRLLATAWTKDENQSNSESSLLSGSDIMDKLKSLYPEYTDLKTEYFWNGEIVETKDNLPYIGEHPDFPNCYFNLCYGDNGDTYNIVGAKIIKDLILYNNNPDAEIFRFNR